MSNFSEGTKVRVQTLLATSVSIGTAPHMDELIGAVGTVQRFDFGDSTYKVMFESGESWWFRQGDLTEVEEDESLDGIEAELSEVTGDMEARVAQAVEQYSLGDLVVILDQTRDTTGVPGCETLLEAGLEITATFEVIDIDVVDGSLLIEDEAGVEAWVLASELVLVTAIEDEGDEEDEELDATFIITGDSVTLSIDGNTDVITISNKAFTAVREAVLVGNYLEAHGLMNPAVGITRWGNGALQITGEDVTYNGMALTGKLVDRVVGMMAEGDEAFKPLANFLNKVLEHPTFSTRSRLMDFAAHDKLDLTADGDVIAFKNVRDDYFDKHSRTFDNSVGNTLSMNRADVDDNHDQDCSNGLHVCSPTYLQGFWGTSGRTMKVIVKPKNFVAIPYTYNDSKARVCEYTVVEEITDSIENYLK